MYDVHGVEEDDFNAAMIHYRIMEDPEIQRIQFENMKKMGMGGMFGGGMGGMGGM